MLRERQHMVLVYDDQAIWMGLLTLGDILKSIIGRDIMGETDNVSKLRRYAKQHWGRRVKKQS